MPHLICEHQCAALRSSLAAVLRAVLESHSRERGDLEETALSVRAGERSAFRYFVNVMDAAIGTGVVQLTIETEPGS